MAYKSKFTGAQIDEAVEKTLSASGGGGGIYQHFLYIIGKTSDIEYRVTAFVLSSTSTEFTLLSFSDYVQQRVRVAASGIAYNETDAVLNIMTDFRYSFNNLIFDAYNETHDAAEITNFTISSLDDTVTPL